MALVFSSPACWGGVAVSALVTKRLRRRRGRSLSGFMTPPALRATSPSRFPRRGGSFLVPRGRHAAQAVDVLDGVAGAERYTEQRILGDRDRQAGRLAQDGVEIGK